MMADEARVVQGRIVAVQESRFRLLTADGRGFLFTLARGARVDAATLGRWQAQGAPVRVTYRGAPGLDSCRAVEVVGQ